MLHVPREYDYRLLGPRKNECIEAIQRSHQALCNSKIPVHGSSQILLKSLCSTKAMMKDKKKVRGGAAAVGAGRRWRGLVVVVCG